MLATGDQCEVKVVETKETMQSQILGRDGAYLMVSWAWKFIGVKGEMSTRNERECLSQYGGCWRSYLCIAKYNLVMPMWMWQWLLIQQPANLEFTWVHSKFFSSSPCALTTFTHIYPTSYILCVLLCSMGWLCVAYAKDLTLHCPWDLVWLRIDHCLIPLDQVPSPWNLWRITYNHIHIHANLTFKCSMHQKSCQFCQNIHEGMASDYSSDNDPTSYEFCQQVLYVTEVFYFIARLIYSLIIPAVYFIEEVLYFTCTVRLGAITLMKATLTVSLSKIHTILLADR